MKRFIEEYRPVSILALFISMVIVLGTLTTGAVLKMHGYPAYDDVNDYNKISIFIRSYGFLLLAVPALWAFWMVHPRNRLSIRYDSRTYLVTGLILLGATLLFFIWTAATVVIVKSYGA